MDPAGVLWFDERYMSFTAVPELPQNLPPVARLTTRKTSVSTTNWTMLMGGASYDPDGTIILYVWDLGDGAAPFSTTSYYVSHRFSESGIYNVTLTVVDDQGAMTMDTITLEAAAGCGCSG
jgi:PKD repeat protein